MPIYLWKGHIIWGLTGRITRHLTALWGSRSMECGAVGPIFLRQPPGVFLWGGRPAAGRLCHGAPELEGVRPGDREAAACSCCLSGRATGLDLYGVELDPTAARAARDNLMENGLGGTVWTGTGTHCPAGQVPLTWWSPIRPTLPRAAGLRRPGPDGGAGRPGESLPHSRPPDPERRQVCPVPPAGSG